MHMLEYYVSVNLFQKLHSKSDIIDYLDNRTQKT